MELKGKSALITGVSKGIGRSLVEQFLKKEMRVTGISRRDPHIKNENFLFIETDIQSQDAVEASFNRALDFLGNQLHVLVNNSGVGFFQKIDEISVDRWMQMFNTNIHGMFYTTRLAVPVMKRQKSGHIVNVASIAGLTGIEEASGYCATKFAVRGFSQSLFKELRKFNIKVSSICPGSVNTDFFDNIESIRANETMLSPDDLAKSIVHILETPDNFLTVETEIRPMNPRYS